VIRINLLGNEKPVSRKAFSLDAGRQVPIACGVLVLTTALGIGYWHWSLTQETQMVEEQIASAQSEQARVRTLLAELSQFEARRGLLQRRVQLIEQLRGGQSVPVQLLDHVSRSLPDSLWLTQLAQDGEAITIEGRSTTLFALSDFVGNLGNSVLLQKPVEIVNSQVEAAAPAAAGAAPAQELIRFVVKAQMAKAAPAPGAAATPAAAPAAAPAR
jgi:type IV pilus assembly protein PilN